MRYQVSIFVVCFSVDLVIGIIQGLINVPRNIISIDLVNLILQYEVILNPLLLFILMYWIGRRLDLPRMYLNVLALTFASSLAGYLTGAFGSFFVERPYLGSFFVIVNGGDYFYFWMAYGGILWSVGTLFTGFSATAIAFFMRSRQGATPAVEMATIVKDAKSA